jgi:thiol-disulfide isomerase/thioredoxin
MALSRREWLILGAVGAATAISGALLAPTLLREDRGASDLLAASFPDLAGRERHLSEWEGSVVLCNFWATWCAPCREEIPMLDALRGEYSRFGFEVVGIAVDNAAKVMEFASKYGISYPILVADADGLDLMRKLGNTMGALPCTVVLGRNGTILSRKLGILRKPEITQQIKNIISNGAG